MTALPKTAYVMSEPHLSGWRVILGYETLADAQAAQSAVSAPEAREGEAVAWTDQANMDILQRGRGAATVWPTNHGSSTPYALYTHSAAPSADKLRIAVEALTEIADTDPDDGTPWFHERADQALADLKAEGAK